MLIYFTTGIDQVEETVGGLIMISLYSIIIKKRSTFNNNTVRKYYEKNKVAFTKTVLCKTSLTPPLPNPTWVDCS